MKYYRLDFAYIEKYLFIYGTISQAFFLAEYHFLFSDLGADIIN